MSRPHFGSLIILFCFLFVSHGAANSPQDVRSVLQKWVETERLASKEEQAWLENRAAMKDVFTALGKEEKILSEKIRTTKNLTVQADRERSGLLKERGSYQKSSAELVRKIADYERQVLNLVVSLPPLLQQELGLLHKTLTNNDDLSLSVRARTVISIIRQIEKFDNTITLTRDIRKLAADKEAEVEILYLGLAQAFYVDKSTKYAGWGEITPEGWYWREKNELAANIREAIDIHESRKAPELVELPLKIIRTGLE